MSSIIGSSNADIDEEDASSSMHLLCQPQKISFDSSLEVKVIEDEQQVASGSERILLFPKLEILQLIKSPKVVTFCNWKCATPNLKAFTTDLTTYVGVGVDVAFDSLKQLEIRENENPLYHHKISVSLFNALEKLILFYYNKGSMSLFSSSVVGNLVNLKGLEIHRCEVVNVIEDKEEKEDRKVVSVGEIRTVVFPKLEELYLDGLPKLVRFCEWKCDVELPSLTKVEIRECPNMENFGSGLVVAPNLKIFEINGCKNTVATKDLNGAMQQHYLARREREKEAEKLFEKLWDEGKLIGLQQLI